MHKRPLWGGGIKCPPPEPDGVNCMIVIQARESNSLSVLKQCVMYIYGRGVIGLKGGIMITNLEVSVGVYRERG